MSINNLQAYQTSFEYSKKIESTSLTKVSYLIKLMAQRNSLSDLDTKHKAWGRKIFSSK